MEFQKIPFFFGYTMLTILGMTRSNYHKIFYQYFLIPLDLLSISSRHEGFGENNFANEYQQ